MWPLVDIFILTSRSKIAVRMFRISCIWLKPGPEFWALAGNCFEPSVLEDLWNRTGKAGFGCPWLILEPCRCVLRNKPDTGKQLPAREGLRPRKNTFLCLCIVEHEMIYYNEINYNMYFKKNKQQQQKWKCKIYEARINNRDEGRRHLC